MKGVGDTIAPLRNDDGTIVDASGVTDGAKNNTDSKLDSEGDEPMTGAAGEGSASAKPAAAPAEESQSRTDVPDSANVGCPGTKSDEAGKADACAGCPNQSACASGAGRAEDTSKGTKGQE